VNNSNRVGAFVLVSLAVIGSAIAGDVTGTWHGRLKVFVENLPPVPSDKQAKFTEYIKKSEAQVISLVLKTDHSFSYSVPSMKTPKTGKWTLKGNTISLQQTREGKPLGVAQTLMLSKDQRTLSRVDKNQVNNKVISIVTYNR